MSGRNMYRGHGSSHSSRHDRRRAEHSSSAHSVGDRYRGSRSSRGDYKSSHHMRERRQGGIRYLSQDELKILAQSSSAEVLECVNDNEAGFLAAYSHERYCMNPLMMKHLIKLLYLLAKTEDFDRIASRIFARILSADGSYALFIMRLDFLIKGMIDESKGYIRRENPQYLNYLIDIGQKAIAVIPETVLNTYPLLVIQKTIQDLIRQGESLDTLDQKAKALEEAFKVAREERSKQVSISGMAEGSEMSIGEPPEHFTDLEILPSLNEVHSGDNKIYLRPNIVKGAYSNWEHYLDVQYRLLREDFVRPLRHGIQQYCTPGIDKHHSQDVRVYERVHILGPVCLFAGIGLEIQFDATRLSRINWEHSRRLIFGSLLCLSNDNFEKSLLFATVVKRDPVLLKEGRLTVKLEGEFSGFHFSPNDVYTMVESTAYFEAYRHILSKLKEISSLSDEIPFKSYIIGCEFANIPAPSYSLHHRHIKFDLTNILGVKSKVILHDESSWPTANCTSLDPSQLEALQLALTKEVSVIQGPPGTGKTFIGLKIVEAFLRNRFVWDRNKEAPILVVCYTNHALDQFLEGIQALSIDEQQAPNIVRIGGRCKSEKLSSSILRNKVKEYQTGKNLPRSLLRKLGESRSAMFKSKSLIDRQAPTAAEGFLRLTELQGVILHHHYQQLTESDHVADGREIETWLELWFPSILSQPVDSQSDMGSDKTTDNTERAAATEAKGSDEYIDVDNEAKLMEDDRIIEGEEIEFLNLSEYRSNSGKRKSPDSESNQAKRSKVVSEVLEFEPMQTSPQEIGGNWKIVQVSDVKRSKMISEGLKNGAMPQTEVDLVHNVWSLPLKKRWQLYNFWVQEYVRYCHDQARTHTDWYEQACERHTECLKEIDEFVLQGSDIVGITTTGAAKHHHVLKKIHPKVVIFEEAAEIFEAHIITSLAPSVQQLVLIGDHKQLQPKPNCFDLELNFKLAISFFERLVKNKIPYVTLNVQHRMRPEISRLIHPSIYSDLKDHKTVQKYDSILGIAKDVFVIDHNEPEKSNKESDVTTHVNTFEADYLVSLCRYLLKQGYQHSKITILTMYRGQLLELKRKMRRKDFEGIRVAAVDDFQGEENDIILLSLVRSNPEKNIGFLSNSNRTCVALSRAKKGLYIIGNLSMLRGKDKTVWPEIISDLEQQQCVGKALPLCCRVHPKAKVLAAVPEDFHKCPEGGCDQMCRTRLPCGHHCPRVCHPNDRDHTRYKCLRDCPKTLSCGHKCSGKCYECSSCCRPCSKKVFRVLPSCGHEVSMPCSDDVAKYPCPRLCTKTLRCGHACQNTCSEPCNLKCFVEVEKTLQCGHKVMELCHKSNSKIICPKQCTAILECGHPCVGTCGNCHMGRLHVRCHQDCGRQLVCGHTCNFPCASVCPPCVMPCNNFCVHSHCPKKCYELCDPCMEPCQWQCEHFRCTQPCGKLCDRPCCDQPCKKLLECGHQCIGLCGEKCPSLCLVCNKDQVTETFFGTEEVDSCFVVLEDCDHFFEVTSLDRWINESGSSSGGDSEVKFATCPKCKTPVRKSLRYCNKVKQTLRDVTEIKRRQLLPKSDLELKFQSFCVTAKLSDHFSFIQDEVHSIESNLKKTNLHPFRINAMSIQIAVLERILNAKVISGRIKRSLASKLKNRYVVCDLELISESLKTLKIFVMQDFLSPQQISEAVSEIQRVSCLSRFCDLLCKLEDKTVSPEDQEGISQAVQLIHNSGWKCKKMTEDSEKSLLDFIEKLGEQYGVCGLSDQERMMVVEAIGLKKGHWYKCRNGHYYCIGECGGAMVEAKCPECGEVIGGRQHRLASDNYHAPEMDESSHPAWSEAANLANYQFP